MSETWFQVLDYLIVAFEWILCYKLVSHLGKPKLEKKSSIIHLVVNIGIVLSMGLLNINPNIRVVMAIVLMVVYAKRCYQISFTKAILASVMFWLLIIVLEALAIVAVVVINQQNDFSVVMVSGPLRVQAILLGKLLMYAIISVICKFSDLYADFPKKYLLYLLIPMSANIINLFVLYAQAILKSNLFSNQTWLIISTVAITTSTIVFILLQGTMLKDQQKKTQYIMLKDKMELQHSYYSNLKKEQERVRKLYHDMRNHISCIQLLANNKAANEYVKKINEELEQLSGTTMISTGNEILDVILIDKQRECKEKGVQFCPQIDFEKCDFMEMIDVTSLFSNIINNAIEACAKVKDPLERTIRLKSTYVDDFFVLVAVNTKANEIRVVEEDFITDKGDSFIHGIGTKNIRGIVEKYQGQVRFEYNEEEFKVRIFIPLTSYVNQIAK